MGRDGWHSPAGQPNRVKMLNFYGPNWLKILVSSKLEEKGGGGGGGVGKDENTKRGGETDDIHPPMGGTGECHMLN